ncbi:MAG TPA: hypothetical protein PLZ49_02945, partial [Bacillota bacterium]|nr:hypothetical protein [Bacillota bacterium]HOL15131.1 hypothetical protein [Bacillota bacterium]
RFASNIGYLPGRNQKTGLLISTSGSCRGCLQGDHSDFKLFALMLSCCARFAGAAQKSFFFNNLS